ncbi:hypothetical protein N7449_006041 [Penicillium cf. viridicatum]|uniref:Uncharacterized protein n=1 Tax=Penicillium cf. viridicatum TaxID=2972119 RepID=A0A9W9MH85_9EURO|nr:hypothetical protein N7449_006041 [Penicillium cf. viridicatum]
MSFCLGEHVDFQLRSQGERDLNELYHIEGFKEYVLEQIVTDEFITNEVRKDVARGNHLFSIVWLLLADYFENREFAFRNSPVSGPDFDNKASHKTLSRWSYTLWATEGKGNPDKTDEIVTFCGKVATISICPPNTTTGLQRPSSVTTVMKSFYSQNGESSSFPSSQVFHTPTGLRAADPEAAQSLNPFQRIGRLDVGHIVFRLQGDEYEAVGIETIEQTKEMTLDRVYALALPGDEQTLHIHGYLVDTNAPGHTLRQTIDMLRKIPGSRRLGVLSHCKEMWPMFKKFDSQCINQRLNWELFGQYKSPDGKSPRFKGSVSFRDQLKTEKALSRPTGVAIDCVARGFSLTAHHPNRLPDGYELPTLGLVDGYLLIQDVGMQRG